MKTISASIVLLSGALLLSAGAIGSQSRGRIIAMVNGGVVLLIGMGTGAKDWTARE
jgi:hypothetical protein